MNRAARTHFRLLIVVGVLTAATVAGMVVLWPQASALPEPAGQPTALEDGVVRSVATIEGEPDPLTGDDAGAVRLTIEVLTGPDASDTVTIETPTAGYPDFDLGDEVKLSPSVAPDGGTEYVVTDFNRLPSLAWLLGMFVVAVLLVGGWRGLRSLVGLGISLVIVTRFVVPAILAGESPFAVALVGALGVMVVTLYLAHGVNEMTTSAVVGTAVALAVTIALGVLFIDVGELTGFASEEATFARFTVASLDLRGLVLAGLIIATLGVLDDVTVTQASAVFALHDTDPGQSWRDVFTSAMRVGRDHIASTVNTLFLAYAGASIALLVLFATGGLPLAEIVNSEVVAEEVTKMLVGSIGLISAVPFTTALATTIAIRRPPSRPMSPRGDHAHGPTAAAAKIEAGATTQRGEVGVAGHDPLVEQSAVLDDDDLAYEAWIRYVREGTEDAERPRHPRDPAEDEHRPR